MVMRLEVLGRTPLVECVPTDEWRAIEADITPLPNDYKVFLSNYGTGSLDDFFYFFSPIASNPSLNLYRQLKSDCDVVRELIAFDDALCYEVYPVTPGLLPFGTTDNGDFIMWHTIGSPDEWPVCIMGARSLYMQWFPEGLHGMIESIHSQGFSSKVIPNPDQFARSDPIFRPME